MQCRANEITVEHQPPLIGRERTQHALAQDRRAIRHIESARNHGRRASGTGRSRENEPPVSTTPPNSSTSTRRGASASVRELAGAVAATAVLAIVLLVVVGGMRTASSRFAGTTTNENSLLSAATIDVSLVGSSDDGVADGDGGDTSAGGARLAIDVANLLPGDSVERCLRVGYSGAIDDVQVRAMGRSEGGTGLDRYLDTEVELGDGDDPECGDFVGATTAFAGTLSALSTEHGDFGAGVPLLVGAADGDAVTVRVRIELRNDNRAQGLDSQFWIVVEARP